MPRRCGIRRATSSTSCRHHLTRWPTARSATGQGPQGAMPPSGRRARGHGSVGARFCRPTTRSNRKRSYDSVPGRAVWMTSRWLWSELTRTSQSSSRMPIAGCRKRFVEARRTATSCSSQRRANSGLAARSSATRAAGSGPRGGTRPPPAARRPARGRAGGGPRAETAPGPPDPRRSGGSCCVLGAGGRGRLRSTPATARSGPRPRRSRSRPSPGCRAAGPVPAAGPGAPRAGRLPARRLLTGEVEEVIVFVLRQAQGAGQRGEHLAGRARSPGLFQPRVVVHGHAGQLGDLLAAQPWCAAACSGREAHVGGAQAGAGAAQEVGEFGAVHPSRVREADGVIQGLAVP